MERRRRPSTRAGKSEAEELAALCARQRAASIRSGRSLHDNAGPLLSAAGIHLQLLKMDMPAAERRIREISGILEQAMENVRRVSLELASSPVYRGGFEAALHALVEETAELAPVDIHLDYAARAAIPRETAVALFDAVSAVVQAAVRQGKATEVRIEVRDKPAWGVRVADNGRAAPRRRALLLARLLAEQFGLGLEFSTGKSTIVSIRAYAARRAAGR